MKAVSLSHFSYMSLIKCGSKIRYLKLNHPFSVVHIVQIGFRRPYYYACDRLIDRSGGKSEGSLMSPNPASWPKLYLCHNLI